MNGIHDLGGMHGFGEVERESGPPGLERWEAAVIAIDDALARTGIQTIDEFRYAIETMDPQDYLDSTYFEHWLDGDVRNLIEKGVITREELEERERWFAANPGAPDAPATPAPPFQRRKVPPEGYRREVDRQPRFAAGDPVRTRVIAPKGHTRLARYVRGKCGTVFAHHGAHVYPDSNAMGRGEDPQHLYTVRFEAAELWGDDAGPREAVFIDLWEPYLQPFEGR
jgi:nitrile hydratase